MTSARDELWDVAITQHGYVTAQQAVELGVSRDAVKQLVRRGALERAGFGVYRFPKFPASAVDRYMLAVLWTRAPEAALSHETALDVYGLSDINPHVIHVTVNKNRRLRRQGGDDYAIHYEDLDPSQLAWWEEVPTVTTATAIAQCINFGTPTYLLRQALVAGREQGRLTAVEQRQLSAALDARHDG